MQETSDPTWRRLNEQAAFSGLCSKEITERFSRSCRRQVILLDGGLMSRLLFLDSAVKKWQNIFLDPAGEKWSYLILKKVFSTKVFKFFLTIMISWSCVLYPGLFATTNLLVNMDPSITKRLFQDNLYVSYLRPISTTGGSAKKQYRNCIVPIIVFITMTTKNVHGN